MSRPIRVVEWAYPRGARVNLRLRFRSQNRYDKVAAEFYNSSGQVIRVEGTSHPGEQSGVAHTDVVLTGRSTRKRRPRHLPVQIRAGRYCWWQGVDPHL
jgi:hypothetical protein